MVMEQIAFNLLRHQSVTEQVENHLFRHRPDHFQKYDYALGFLFALTTLLSSNQAMINPKQSMQATYVIESTIRNELKLSQLKRSQPY